MKGLKYILLLMLSLVLTTSCEDNEYGTGEFNYVSFEASSIDVPLFVGTTESVTIKVFSSQETGSDRTIMVSASEDSTLDPAAYSLPESVTIPANSNVGELVVQISDVNFGAAASLIIDMVYQEGSYIGESVALNIEKICDFPASIDFVFDGYASETTWDIKNSSNTILASGGSWSDGTATASVEVCLANGDYTLTVYDSYGDGLTWPNLGSVSVSYKGTVVATMPGDFGAEGTLPFTIAD